MKSWRYLAIVAVYTFAGCGEDPIEGETPLNIDRPVDVAFACTDISGEREAATAMAQCVAASKVPLTRDINGVATSTIDHMFYAFALESEAGTVAVSRYAAYRDAPPLTSDNETSRDAWSATRVAVDVDPLSPRINGIAVGSAPVAIATDRDGCHLVTANAGSCDLSVVSLAALFGDQNAKLSLRVAVATATGPLLARPAAMAAETEGSSVDCLESPSGLVYVAYPACHTVAAVIAGTGEIVAHIDFAADGSASVIAGNALSCPAECGAGAVGSPGPRPSTLDLLTDNRTGTRRLAIGTEDGNRLTVVDLDPTFRPLAVLPQVTLEGEVGVIDVALTPTMVMGGSDSVPDLGDDAGGEAQFVYAVVTDGTVRVARIIGEAPRECETQVDPRYLGAITDPAELTCLPIGVIDRPRRPGAIGPGIALTNSGIPTAVTVVKVQAVATQLLDANKDKLPDDTTLPPVPMLAGRQALVGTFAFVSSSFGSAAIINIDDDSYPDFENPALPLAVELTQALPHSLRDGVENRSQLSDVEINSDTHERAPTCNGAEPEIGSTQGPTAGGSRLVGAVNRQSDAATLAAANLVRMPSLRHVRCVGTRITAIDAMGKVTAVEPVESTVPELAFSAPPAERAASFPDLRALPFNQSWRFTWEGFIADQVRKGLVPVDGTGMRIQDAGRPFCALGVEPYDNVTLMGCDPTTGDADCSIGERCFVHPDAQPGTAGSCLPAGEVDLLAGPCRDFLIGRRRYAITSAEAGQLRLSERRRVLRTTPISGCTDAPQCMALADEEQFMAVGKAPSDLIRDRRVVPNDLAPLKNWVCEPDPSRALAINRCQQRCNDDLPRRTDAERAAADMATCSAGTVCSQKGSDGSGYCVEGVVPPLQCVRGRQRYLLRGTDAFVVTHVAPGDLGPATYDHPIVANDAGVCVRDPAASPLVVGRIPLRPPPCTTDGASPNPCSTQVVHTEAYFDFVPGTCEPTDPTPSRRERTADAVRVQLPGFTTHVVDPTYPGDLVCRGDRLGALVDVPHVSVGAQLNFQLIAGFLAQTVGALVYPVNVVRAPDDAVWLVDEGKRTTSTYRGGLLRYNPATNRGLLIE